MEVNTKYDIGNNVFYMSNNQVSCGKVTDVYIEVDSDVDIKISYSLNNETCVHPESELFSSKKELIDTL